LPVFYTILMPFYALSLGFDAAEEVSARFRVATVLPGAFSMVMSRPGSMLCGRGKLATYNPA